MRYFRIKQRRIKQTSPLQQKRRFAFIQAANARTLLTDHSKISLWKNYAQTHTQTNKKGQIIRLSWWNLFMKINIYRAYNGLPTALDPPHD